MSGLKQPIQDILTKMQTLDVRNGDGNTVKLVARMWNNQLRMDQEGKMQVFAKPAGFLEVVSPATYEIIGQGFRSSDISFRVHLITDNLNTEGYFEQDLTVFDLRDKVIGLLSGYKPTGCGELNSISEQQDYDHNNLYHYIIDFVCNFTDTKGSKLDADKPDAYVESGTPTTLILSVTADDEYIKPQ